MPPVIADVPPSCPPPPDGDRAERRRPFCNGSRRARSRRGLGARRRSACRCTFASHLERIFERVRGAALFGTSGPVTSSAVKFAADLYGLFLSSGCFGLC